MKISVKEWVLYIVIAALAAGAWYKLEYPQFRIVDLSVDRNAAIKEAEAYLRRSGVATEGYLRAAVFESDRNADAYLQKQLGRKGEEEFILKQGYELFSWKVRFFKEQIKEEYVVRVSPRAARVIGFSHLIDDIEARETAGKEEAKKIAEEFLGRQGGLMMQNYLFHEEKARRYEHRTDYSFSWEDKGVSIPWKKGEGVALLLAGATVSGNEITEFYVSRLDMPEKFRRYMQNNFLFGAYLYSFYMLFLTALIGCAAAAVITKLHSVEMLAAARVFLWLGAFSFLISLASVWNNISRVIMEYPTTSRLSSFIGLYWTGIGIRGSLFSLLFIVPGLAGEALRGYALPGNRRASLAYYLRSGFFNRGVARSIVFGYLLCCILIGVQAIAFQLGYRYLGVWKEWFRLTEFSSEYLPLLGAFAVAFLAALGEETIFRLFGITWAKTVFKNTAFAVFLTAAIWGLGHSGSEIFPAWFRVAEVTVLGVLYGFFFLRYGILPVLIAHYVFNMFWGTAAHLFGRGSADLFSGAIALMAFPLLVAVVAYIVNRPEREKEIRHTLTKAQKYNLGILVTYISSKRSQGADGASIKAELLNHGWDPLLVEMAIEEADKT
jgi:hypothetical protein